MNPDVAVIGGGAIGLACAWRLAQAGARVELFERGQVGREASWAAAGMLAAQIEAAHHPPDAGDAAARAAMFELCLQSRALYPSFADELLEATGVDIGLSLHNERGGICFVATREDDATVERLRAQRAMGQRIAPLSEAPKRLVDEPARGAWLPDEGCVENRRLVPALRAACERVGVVIHENAPVRLRVVGGKATALETSQAVHGAGQVLLCAGAWSGEIEGLPSGCRPPVAPVMGQCLMLANAPLPYVVYGSDVYLVPRCNERTLVGATMEQVGFCKQTTADGARHLRDAAHALLPRLADATVEEHWAGLRPATPDGLPILGRTPLNNLFVATGHFRNGILLTPATANLMASCILHDAETPSAFSIERFHEDQAERRAA